MKCLGAIKNNLRQYIINNIQNYIGMYTIYRHYKNLVYKNKNCTIVKSLKL